MTMKNVNAKLILDIIRDCKNQGNDFHPLAAYLMGKDLGPRAANFLRQCDETKVTAEGMYLITKFTIEATGAELYNLEEVERSLGEKV